MTRSLTLLCLLAWYVAASGSSPQSTEIYGEWSSPMNVGRTREHRIQRYVRDPFAGRIDDVLHLGSSRRSRTR